MMVWASLMSAGKRVNWLTESVSVSVSWPQASEIQAFIQSKAGDTKQKELNKRETSFYKSKESQYVCMLVPHIAQKLFVRSTSNLAGMLPITQGWAFVLLVRFGRTSCSVLIKNLVLHDLLFLLCRVNKRKHRQCHSTLWLKVGLHLYCTAHCFRSCMPLNCTTLPWQRREEKTALLSSS